MCEAGVSIRQADPAYNHSISRDNLRPASQVSSNVRSRYSRQRKLQSMPGIVYEFRVTDVDPWRTTDSLVFDEFRHGAARRRSIFFEIRKLSPAARNNVLCPLFVVGANCHQSLFHPLRAKINFYAMGRLKGPQKIYGSNAPWFLTSLFPQLFWCAAPITQTNVRSAGVTLNSTVCAVHAPHCTNLTDFWLCASRFLYYNNYHLATS